MAPRKLLVVATLSTIVGTSCIVALQNANLGASLIKATGPKKHPNHNTQWKTSTFDPLSKIRHDTAAIKGIEARIEIKTNGESD